MKSNLQRIQFFVWGFLFLVIFGIVGAFVWSKVAKPFPPPLVYNDAGHFSLTNQLGQGVSEKSLAGQIWIADVIFTRCPLQCIRMTKRMRELQEGLIAEKSVRFLSLTTDPKFDSPEVLKAYAEKFAADQGSWWFLTGSGTEINRLAVTGLKLAVYEKKPEEREVPADLFLHSTRFVLVDGLGRTRGWFDGEKPEAKAEIIRAVQAVLKERN
ncbi:MAG: SCO family protein [Verrucomicrobiota bacterium]